MSAQLLSFPFRLAPSGSAVTLSADSDEYYAEEIAALVVTRRGERILVPSFGIDDPVFQGVDRQDIALAVATFGPPVDIVAVTTRQVDDSHQDVVITFQRSLAPSDRAGIRIATTDVGVV